jgi:Mn-dependent DtxR family transcriptional regulator
MRVLTELDKTILLTFLVSGKGTAKYVDQNSVILKFPIRQRKMVLRYIKKLEKDKLLSKHVTKESYKLTEEGLKRAFKLLHEGARLWTYR